MSKVGVGLLLTAALVLTPLWAAHAEFKVGVVDGMDVVSKSAARKSGSRTPSSVNPRNWASRSLRNAPIWPSRLRNSRSRHP